MSLPKAPSMLGNFLKKNSKEPNNKGKENLSPKKILMKNKPEISDAKKTIKQKTKKIETVKKGKSTSVLLEKVTLVSPCRTDIAVYGNTENSGLSSGIPTREQQTLIPNNKPFIFPKLARLG